MSNSGARRSSGSVRAVIMAMFFVLPLVGLGLGQETPGGVGDPGRQEWESYRPQQDLDESPAVFTGDGTNDSFVIRNKPDVAAADGVSTTSSNFTTFFGTSASAPHAAAIAALMIEATPGLQSEALAAAGIPLISVTRQTRSLFNASSLDIENPGLDNVSGAGILDANAALLDRTIFADGFESGDTLQWTSQQP